MNYYKLLLMVSWDLLIQLESQAMQRNGAHMEHVIHCPDCNKKNKGADVFDLGFGSEIGLVTSVFLYLKWKQVILFLICLQLLTTVWSGTLKQAIPCLGMIDTSFTFFIIHA